MTIRQILQVAITHLSTSTSPRLDAQLLLCHVLEVDKAYLVAYDDRMLSEVEIAAYQALVNRRAAGEPVAYLIGRQGFYDLDFIVTPDVLIPRPETEHLIEAALQWAREKSSPVAADIGTGSGAIAVTFARHAPQSNVHAVDVSPAALTIARKNAAANGVTVQFHEGYLAQPLIAAGIRVDLLMANLPYIRSDDMPHVAVSQHEPRLALDGGDDGLDLIRALLQQAAQVCYPGALILLEIGAEQGQAVLDFAQSTLNPHSITILRDYAGHDRVVRIKLLT